MPQKVLCHRAEEAKDFRCCTTDCLFCNVIGGDISLQKVININEARGISRMSPDPLIGEVWGRD